MNEQKRQAAPPRKEVSRASADFISHFDAFFSDYDHLSPGDNFDPEELSEIERAWLNLLGAAAQMAYALRDYSLKTVDDETAL